MKCNIKKFVCGMLACILLAALVGCGSGREFTPDGNGMYVSKDGVISTAFEVEVDKAYYTEDGMRTFVENEVIAYNKAKGASAQAYQDKAAKEEVLPVAIAGFTFGNKAQLILTYKTPADYVAFNEKDETTAAKVMYATAKETASLPDMSFTAVEDGAKIAASSIIGERGLKIVMIQGAQNVQVQGKLVYVSDNVTVTGEDTATTGAQGYSYLVFK